MCGCARPSLPAATGTVAIARPTATVQPTAAEPPRTPQVEGSLQDANYWLLDSSGTFDHALHRGGAWLVSLVTVASSDSPASELAANLRVAKLQQRSGSWAPTAEELESLPGYVSPPRAVWILSQDRAPCAADVDPSPRVDFYDHGVPAMEVAHALSGCDLQGALELGFSGVQPPPDVRWQPAKMQYERKDDPDLSRSWDHPLSKFLVSAPSDVASRADLTPGRQSIQLLGIDSEPQLLDLFTGIVWDDAPENEDDYDACKAVVVSHHEVGFLDGRAWTPLPASSAGEVHLLGAAVVGARVEAVVGTWGTKAAVLPVANPRRVDSGWSLLDTGVYPAESSARAEPRLGPHCVP
jgi:hypothetical protein